MCGAQLVLEQTVITLYFFTSSGVDAAYESYLEDPVKKIIIK